jgi:endoribonuclease LACTB2
MENTDGARPRAIADDVARFAARTPTLPPASETNSYALGSREVLLVEPATPYEDERAAWLGWARGLAAEGRRLVGILLTHHHVDHASAAGHFARALDLPLFAHRETLCRTIDLEGARLRPIDDGYAFVLDGPTPRRWIALHTPGHAPGHLCLHEQTQRLVVAGDMVANGSTILIPPDDGGDMRHYLEQLRRLDALDAARLFPAHGEPIDDAHTLLTHYVAHRLAREAKVLDAFLALAQSLGRPPSLDEIVPRAYADTPKHLWPIAIASADAHLRKLRDDGLV